MNIKEEIRKLKAANIEARIYHLRVDPLARLIPYSRRTGFYSLGENNGPFFQKDAVQTCGGVTLATILQKGADGNMSAGSAICSVKDSFCYSHGAKIALHRAMAKAGLIEEDKNFAQKVLTGEE